MDISCDNGRKKKSQGFLAVLAIEDLRFRGHCLKFKHIYITSIKKQVLAIYANLSGFCFLGTTPGLMLMKLDCILNRARIAQFVRALDLKTRGCGFDFRVGQLNSY